jgi:hypothetical protein
LSLPGNLTPIIESVACIVSNDSVMPFLKEIKGKITRSKAWVYGRLLAWIVGSNPAGGMDVCLCWMLFVVRYRSLRRTDHSSREGLPTVMRRCVWYRNLKNREATVHVGPQRHRKKKKFKLIVIYLNIIFCVIDSWL